MVCSAVNSVGLLDIAISTRAESHTTTREPHVNHQGTFSPSPGHRSGNDVGLDLRQRVAQVRHRMDGPDRTGRAVRRLFLPLRHGTEEPSPEELACPFSVGSSRRP